MGKDNIHSGHRARLMQKFDKDADLLNDHELLEAVLFNIIPRVDTNPTAHRLLRAFGSLSGVFSASVNELCSVEGVGVVAARKLKLLGKLYERMGKEKVSKKTISSRDSLNEYVISEFMGLKKERLDIHLLNAKYRILHTLSYEGGEYNRVTAEPKELLSAIGAHKPKYLLIAHNHPSGSLLPSVNDDYSTANVIKLCDLLNVEVIDHLIIADGEYYSYAFSGHLDEVRSNANYYKMKATGKAY